ncbi:MAG: hypothetical protein ACK583_02470 [Cyanobacteriota bacterium]|jgi:hypothetical protein
MQAESTLRKASRLQVEAQARTLWWKASRHLRKRADQTSHLGQNSNSLQAQRRQLACDVTSAVDSCWCGTSERQAMQASSKRHWLGIHLG